MEAVRADSESWAREVDLAARRLRGVVASTPLERCKRLSLRYGAEIHLKREDLQEVRSFKIRGAYNLISALSPAEAARGVVCASAGNHAQGVAFACARLGIHATVFMPVITPNQKIERVRGFGGDALEIVLAGDSYDDADHAARERPRRSGGVFVHPFDDLLTIAGQGTVAREVTEELEGPPDLMIAAAGGGGLVSGIAAYLEGAGAPTRVYAAEPAGAASLRAALDAGGPVKLEEMDTFVDGAAVRTVGELPYALASRLLSGTVAIPEGRLCTTVIELYQQDGIIAEPAGALAVSALEDLAEEIRGKTAVCVVSGGNNDVLRYPEMIERSLVHQGRKHYFIVEFAQKPGQLRRFVDKALGPTDDITRFEYFKKTNKERGAALIGIELRSRNDLEPLLERMDAIHLNYRRLRSDEVLYEYLV